MLEQIYIFKKGQIKRIDLYERRAKIENGKQEIQVQFQARQYLKDLQKMHQKIIMQKQQDSLSKSTPSLPLNQILIKTMKQYPPHPTLEPLLNILSQLGGRGNESTRQLQKIINKLCDQILKLNDRPIKVDDFRKEEEVQILFKKFISIEHHKEILVNNKSEPMVIKYRYIISEYFHYLIHYTTLKNITKLCVLFYKFVSLQMLERKIVNFFFLNLILSHENLTLNHDIKYIKMCLRSLYKNNVLHIKATLDQTPQLKRKGQESYPINYHLYSNIKLSSLSFILIAYIIYFGNISSSKCTQQMKSDTDMIQDIVSKPINIVSIVQQFRNQFPKVQVYKCVRDLDSVSQCIVDNYFLKSLFGIYLDYKLNPVHKQYVYNIIENLIKFNLTLHTVKSLIKKLEITDQQNYEQKWKNVFVLLKTTFPNHNKIQQKFRQSKQIPSFTCLEEDEPLRNTELSWTKGLTNANSQQSEVQKLIVEKNTLKFTYFSHLNYTLEHEFNGFFITFKSYRILDWYIILKLKNDQNQLWVTVRHIDQNQFQLQIIKITNGSFTYMTKDQIQWDPFEKHVLECSLEDDQILFKFGTQQISLEQALNEEDFSPSEKKIKQTLKMKNIRPKQIILGANSNDIPNYLTQVSNFEIKYCQGKITYNFIHHNKYKINKISTNVKMVPLESLSLILKKLGQIDLFFLITSHLIRKVENDECLKKMLKQVNDFLQYLVVFKGVSGLKFNQQLRELRFYNVRCLVWLASKSKKDPKIILQILRLLQIRKIKRPIQLLEILSNIGLWKQIPAKSHMLIIDKIKQHCRQAEIQKASQMIDQLKKIILDFNLYYKDSQLFAQNLQEDYLQKHSQILKLIYDVVSNQKISAILDFILFNLKILFIVLDKTKSNDYIDTTIGYELTLLVFRLLYTARQSQFEKAQRQKNKSPGKKTMKMSKLFALSSSRSMNLPLRFGQNDRDDQSHALKIQQILAWIHEILFILKNQVLVTQQKIKYFDWDWDYKLTSTRSTVLIQNKGQQGQKSRQISQTKILTYCQHIQIGLMSFNRNIFNALVMSQLSDAQWQVFWNMNLFDEKISVQRFLDTLKLGNFNKINWDDEKIISVLSKSFDLFDSGSSMRLPSKLVESMKIKDITNIHNTLLGTYLQKSQQNNPLERQKCAQKIMFLIALIPDSLYTNTHLLRQEIRKQKRNIKTVELIQKHLIVKQLAKESFKFINQMKQNENKDKTSTIFSFNDSIEKKEPKISFLDPSDTMNKSDKSDKSESFISNISEINQKKNQQGQKLSVFSNTDYQKSFLESKSQVISTQKIKESLEYYKLLATPNQIQQFYKVTSSNQDKKQVQQQIQGHIINFNISIDAIISILEQSGNIIEKLNQLQNFIFFIEKHIYSFSKMILTEHMFTEVSPPQTQQLRPRRKKSFKSNNYKFKQESDFILDQFLKDRRKSHYRMENIWTNVQKNNKDFWEVFFKSQKKNQCVDQTCNSMKVKGLIKIDHQKRQIQLPKNMTSISNKFSLSGDSDKQLQPEGLSQASIFGDISVYQQQQSFQRQKQDAVSKQNVPINSKDIHLLKRQQKKANQFSVLYITTTKIYQGLMLCGNNTIHFIQDKSPDEGFYEIICANQHERRAANEIQKKRQEFEITLNDKSTIIPKRYLYYDAAVEIYSQRRAYFFVFRKSVKREQFLLLLQNIKGTILNEDHLIQTANKQMQRWMNGDISNYTYLMHLNDLSGRSFNDMSQYYIFPWIITNFKSNKFNKKFISSQNNYRDLSKPVGALNQKRLGQLMSRYRESQKYKEIASYLYGSFCSNPAIVCNYLVRLQPFSMFHYLLQSKQFDLADRIFYSISNQFTCCYSNVGDYKQLIPQFFSAPEFLRNRNKYKFGQKQNKEIVNNVQLPQWALYQFGSTKNSKMADKLQNFQPQQQFVFRMRKCLQSSYVTSNLNNWIDLMFGQYNQKQKAMERQNLYIESLYKNELSKNKNNKNKQTCLIFFKQFGQMPRDLFDKDHKTYKNSRTSYKIGNSEIYSIAELTNQTKVGKKYYADHRFFIYWDENTLNIINIKNKSGLLQKTEYELSQTPTNGQITELKSFNAESHSEDKKNDVKIDFLIYLKDGKVMLREIGVTTFRKKLQIKQQKQSPETLDNKFHILEINQDQKQIILVESNNIQVYNYSLQVNNLQKSGDLSTLLISNQNNWNEQNISIPLGKKIDFKLSLKLEFSQHRSKIEHLKYSNSFGIIISIDSNRKVYVSKLNSKQFQILQYFRLKKLTHCQSILQMQIHQMGYIYILTSLNIVHMYNLMGDYVAGFSGITLREINKKMQQKIDSRIEANKQIQSKSSIGSKQQKGRKKSGSQIPVGGKFNTFQIQQDQSQIITTGNARSDQNSGSRRESLMDQGPQQIIISFEIWNQESGQIVFGTNFTNFYRVDMFMIDDCEKVSLSSLTKQKGRRKKSTEKMDKNNQDIQFFNVKRIGRHWQCWVASSDELFKMQSEDYRNAQKRNEQYHKKYVLD